VKTVERTALPGVARRATGPDTAARAATPVRPAPALATSIEAAGTRVRPGSGGADVLPPATILRLQRSAGNRGVLALLEGVRAQARRPGPRRAPDSTGIRRGRRVVQRDLIDDLGDAVSGTVESVSSAASGAAGAAWDTARDVANTAVGAANQAGGMVAEGARQAWDTASEGADQATDAVASGARAVGSAAREVASDATEVASEVVGGMVDAASGAWDSVTETATDVGTAVVENAEATWDEATGVASGVIDGVTGVAGDAWDLLADTARGVASGASEVAGNVWSAVADGAEGVWNGVQDMAGAAWETASDAASGAWEALTTTASEIASGIGDLAADAWNGLKGAAGAAWDAVSGGIRSLWSSLGNGVGRALRGIARAVPLPGSDVRSRALSAGERAYAQGIFADTIDYDPIVITRGSVMSVGSARATGNAVNLVDRDFVGDTMELSGGGYATLIHEMTHVFQYQHGGLGYIPESLWEQAKAWAVTGNRNNAYEWQPLDAAGVPWEQWNVEQQAYAVEQYNIELRKMEAGEPYNAALLARLQPYVERMRAGPRA
jgi:hypothetical protein